MSVQAIGWAFDQTINDPLAKLVLLALANHSNGKSGRCTPTVDTLATECAQTPGNVKKKLAALDQGGFLKRVARFATDGRQLANGYVLLLNPDYRPFASVEPQSPDEVWEDGGGYSNGMGGGYPKQGEGIPGEPHNVSPESPPGYPPGAPHIEPEIEPENKNRNQEQILGDREDLFETKRGSTTTPPPQSPTAAVPQTEAVPGTTTPHPRSAAPLPSKNATVVPPVGKAGGCGEPKRRTQPKSPPQDGAGFEVWWAAYPKKVDKGAARKAYAAARKKASAEQLVEGVKRYVEALNARAVQDGRDKPDPQFIKNPSGWLAGERWLDTPASPIDVNQRETPRHPNGPRPGSVDETIMRQLRACERMGF